MSRKRAWIEVNPPISNPLKLPCVSYEELLLLFPAVLAQLIWCYMGWAVEEIISAMEKLMSIPSWCARQDNSLILVNFKFPVHYFKPNSSSHPLRLDIHSFYSTEKRCGGDVHFPRRCYENKMEWLKQVAERVIDSKNQKLVISFFKPSKWVTRHKWATRHEVTEVILRNERNLCKVKVLLNSNYEAILDLSEIFASPNIQYRCKIE